MYLAVLEGLAFGIRALYEDMRNTEVVEFFSIVGGGGAKISLWTQLFANILQIPIIRINNTQEAVYGTALLAILGLNGPSNFEHNNYEVIQPQTQLPYLYEKNIKII